MPTLLQMLKEELTRAAVLYLLPLAKFTILIQWELENEIETCLGEPHSPRRWYGGEYANRFAPKTGNLAFDSSFLTDANIKLYIIHRYLYRNFHQVACIYTPNPSHVA